MAFLLIKFKLTRNFFTNFSLNISQITNYLIMRRFIIALLMLPLFSFAQQKGISFEHNTNWAKVKEKAKAENKYIFVDCFTTWCGPCTWMSENVFPQEKVGTYFNDKFVSLKLQMDKTDKDSEDVKSWYDEAVRFGKDYSVRAYPTFLVFDPNGELVHRIVGGGEADDFIASVSKSLNPETQYVTLVKKFEQNPKDVKIAKQLIAAAESAYDEETSAKAVNAFINLVDKNELLTADNISILLNNTKSTAAPSFAIIRDNKDKINKVLADAKKEGSADDVLSSIIIYEKVIPKLQEGGEDIDFAKIQKDTEAAHPYVNLSKSFARLKAQFHMHSNDWPGFKNAVEDYLKLSGNNISAQELNSFAWTIFENCADVACLQAALNWSKKSIDLQEEAAYLDTYANLLYRTGDQANAIKWQEKALSLASNADKEQYKGTLEKMKANTPTWE